MPIVFNRYGPATGLLLFAFALLNCAWLCDDAYITFRSIDNFVNGYGPTWNIGERVQSFTHPLWFIALSAAYFFTGEIYYTALLASATISLVAASILALSIAPNWKYALLGIALLSNSKAFVDYSTSGLENPLTHLLAALFAWCYLHYAPSHKRLFSLSLLAALAMLNRMDTALLFLPALLYAYAERRSWRTTAVLICGFAPIAAWEIFSVIYYGFPFPNTAYAKLGSGIAVEHLLRQGVHYFANSFQCDPLTLSTIAIAVGSVLWRRERTSLPIALGIVFYLLYIARIGGDFMSGRFLAAPFFFAVVLLVSLKFIGKNNLWAGLILLVFLTNVATPYSPLRSDARYGLNRNDAIDRHKIADERASYYPFTGLRNALRAQSAFPSHGWADWGRRLREFADGGISAVVTWPYVGFAGYYAGPDCHFLDIHGLADPLTARLPMRQTEDWRIGHFQRILPAGYLETHLYGLNLIEDRGLAAYYDKLQSIIRGDLFSVERFREIWRINSGYYDSLIDRKRYAYPSEADVERTDAVALELAVTFKPDPFASHSGLGDLYYRRQQYEAALSQYNKAAELGLEYTRQLYPDDYQQKLRHLYLHLARTLLALGEKFSAREILQKYLHIFGNDPVVSEELAKLSS